jgi:hypothetical protein
MDSNPRIPWQILWAWQYCVCCGRSHFWREVPFGAFSTSRARDWTGRHGSGRDGVCGVANKRRRLRLMRPGSPAAGWLWLMQPVSPAEARRAAAVGRAARCSANYANGTPHISHAPTSGPTSGPTSHQIIIGSRLGSGLLWPWQFGSGPTVSV